MIAILLNSKGRVIILFLLNFEKTRSDTSFRYTDFGKPPEH